MKKRKDGRYKASIVVGSDENGKQIRKYVYGSKDEVTLKLAESRVKMSKGISIDEKNTTLSEYARKWFKLNKSTKEYNTKVMYEYAIEGHILPQLGHIKLKDLKKHHIQELINQKHADGLTRTLEMIKLTIRQILNQAVEDEYIYKNVAKKLDMPSHIVKPKRTLTDYEISLIGKADITLKANAFLYTLLWTGVRPGELLALTKNDIDFKKNLIKINKTVVFKVNQPEIKNMPKTTAGIREIPIVEELKTLLIEYMKTVDAIYLFPSESKSLMSKSARTKFWSGIIKKLNLAAGGNDKIKAIANDITPYIFRHTYATMLYYAGVDIKKAQYLLGHKSILITYQIYTHLESKENANTPNQINQYMISRGSTGGQNKNVQNNQEIKTPLNG